MSNVLSISHQDIIRHIRFECQIPNVLEAIAARKIIADAAASNGIKVESEELQQAGDNLRLAKKLVKASDTWIWLKTHNLSLDEFEEIVHASVLTAKLANHLFAKQVETFFFAHQLDYVAAATYEIVLDSKDLALELFYALKEDEISFPDIARKYIQNQELTHTWGYQGIRCRKDFPPVIASSIFAANAPEILKPIETSQGVYLIWVEKIIHPKLDEQLRAQIQQDLFVAWLKQQSEQLKIVIKENLDSNYSVNQSNIKVNADMNN
ncbi:MAG: peptidylprolyl isomerase [Scytonematopsis contorta HA4267-MV1]|jgi:parvulin-like peptidyl-prolyl isomerase|nr:peptidylprolyl isomerase [Scytonematopsis contorta HA4267-MV1]